MNTPSEQNESQTGILPDPMNATLDLDAFVMNGRREEDPLHSVPLPHWIRQLNEQTANRMLGILTASKVPKSERRKDFARELESAHPRGREDAIVDSILDNSQTVDWIRRRLEDPVESEDVPILNHELPSAWAQMQRLREAEQDLIVLPNITRLFAEHEKRIGGSAAQKMIARIDRKKNAHVPLALQEYFSTFLEISSRYEERVVASPGPRIITMQDDIVNMMEQKGKKSLQVPVHAFYTDHLLYSMAAEEKDVQLLLWMHEHMADQAVAIHVLSDRYQDHPFNTRGGFRSFCGVKQEDERQPQMYQEFLQRHGIHADVVRANLTMKAQCARGQVQLREWLRISLPPRMAADTKKIQRYIEGLKAESNGIFEHSIAFLLCYKNASSAPKVRQQPASVNRSPVLTERQITREHTSNTLTDNPLSSADLTPFIGRSNGWTVREAVTVLEIISAVSDGGTNAQNVRTALETLHVARATYLQLLEHAERLERLAMSQPDIRAMDVIQRKSRKPTPVTERSVRRPARRERFRAPSWSLPSQRSIPLPPNSPDAAPPEPSSSSITEIPTRATPAAPLRAATTSIMDILDDRSRLIALLSQR